MEACCALCTHCVLTLLNDCLKHTAFGRRWPAQVVAYTSAELHEPQLWPRQEKAAYDLIEQGLCGYSCLLRPREIGIELRYSYDRPRL